MMLKKLKDLQSFVAGDETILKEWLHPKNGDPATPYSLAHAVIEPGKSSLPHRLKERSEVYIVLEGRGTAYVDQKPIPLAPEELLFIPAGAEQYVVNEGKEPLEFLCIVSPPWEKDSEVVQ